ncbi:2-hydroxyacid dehydrogenase [Citreimonas sp.]|uniref:2-hydroxyacid dehydrogenase n=1 Tax=Citreimonas sp. TaxID=3036715 RepID=UPI0035C81044
MTKPEILVLGTTMPARLDALADAFTLHRLDAAPDPEALLDAVGPRIRGVATTGGKGLSRALLARLRKLEIVASAGVGYDSIDVQACSERGVVVTNTLDVLTDDVADLAIGLVIAARRNMIGGHAHVATGAWGREGSLPLNTSLRGRRLGILGLGRIGRVVAARAEPFGLEIGYTALSKSDGLSYTFRTTPRELAEWADILVVTVPGGAETAGLVDAEVLRALGPQGTLVNVARGSVVDEAALIDALAQGRIAGAALDVFDNEPNQDPALTRLPNVVLHPHHASGTVESRDAMAALVNDNLRAHFDGRPVPTPVNAPRSPG